VADGTVDAQENPLTKHRQFRVAAHHRFVSLTAHLFGVALLLTNRGRFDAWPADIQAAVKAAAVAATLAQRREAEAEDDICYRRLIADGVDIIPAKGLDRTAFEQAV